MMVSSRARHTKKINAASSRGHIGSAEGVIITGVLTFSSQLKKFQIARGGSENDQICDSALLQIAAAGDSNAYLKFYCD